jgi:enoyl-[acyl-carrier protein] reductase II
LVCFYKKPFLFYIRAIKVTFVPCVGGGLMKATRFCDLLGLRYPIVQGGMLWLATAELAAAVSNADALGVISPLAGMKQNGDPSENLKNQLSKIRRLTNKPFGVNIPLNLSYAGVLIDLLLHEKIGVVITGAGDPGHYTDLLKHEGAKVLHVVSNVKQAKKAEKCNVDAIIAQGIEGAAHNGYDELPLFSLLPQIVDAVSIPVIAAGGIVDTRGLVAAMALGAEGVQLGTRFVAVEESIAHPAYKQAVLDASDTDTVITCRKLIPTRSLKTEFSNRLVEMESLGASDSKLLDYLGYRSNRVAQVEGDLTEGEAYCGASAGLIKEILPAGEVIQRLVNGYNKVIKDLY